MRKYSPSRSRHTSSARYWEAIRLENLLLLCSSPNRTRAPILAEARSKAFMFRPIYGLLPELLWPDKRCAATAFNGQRTRGYGTASPKRTRAKQPRRRFSARKVPVTNHHRPSKSGWGNKRQRHSRFTVEGTAIYATQQSLKLCGKSARCTRLRIG